MRFFKPSLLFAFVLLAATSCAVPYEQYILAPASRDLAPQSIHAINGSVVNAASLTRPSSTENATSTGNATLRGSSSVTFDFGRNIGGLVSLDVASVSSRDAYVGVTFTESSVWISSQASDATADAGRDSPLWFAVGKGPGKYTAEKKHVRGGFRYLTISTNTNATVSVRGVKVHFTAAPSQKDLRAYKGYFHSDDELLNRIWYAGAYTNQLCSIDPTTGDALPFMNKIKSTDNITLPRTDPWYSNYTITNATSTITDGAKRDRLVWPGDMSVALESIAVSTADIYSARTALETLFANQKRNGQLPYAGPPFAPSAVSFTYHLHSLIGVSYYYRFSGDKKWLSKYWRQYKRGVQWALSSVDDSGLANITAPLDWLRFGMGGRNIEANAILYGVLNQAETLAKTVNDTSSAANWTGVASGIKSAANKKLWDSKAGLYHDNETTTLHPQDGNVWAIKANLTLSDKQNAAISSSLSSRWGPYGAPAPEAGKTVSPFISAFELQAHYMAGQADRALDLMRQQWGFMLDDPRMTNSTFIEGYSTDGSLHYAPYANVARISLAHGWSTGPTFALINFAAGLQLTGPAGASWLIAPQPGNLTEIDAGFSTHLGLFSAKFQRTGDAFSQFSFSTPNGTTGDVRLPGTKGSLVLRGHGRRVKLVDGVATGLKGGNWKLEKDGS